MIDRLIDRLIAIPSLLYLKDAIEGVADMYAISWIDVRDRAAVEASVQTFDMLWAVGCFGGAADELARSLHDADTFIVGAQRIRSMILWPPGACGGYAEVADALVGGQPLVGADEVGEDA